MLQRSTSQLPLHFERWFASRGWQPRAHQLSLLAHAQAGDDALLIAPTGAGKTLAGFLPSLIDIPERRRGRNRPGRALHTLYISPLKALAVDVQRNLEIPLAELGLPINVETRTGDTSASKRMRQRRAPPDILLTTPEQLALLLATADAKTLFADLQRVVLDELHALVTSKRGDLLSLGLARLRALAPRMRATGLSATVRDPDELRRWLVGSDNALAELVTAPAGAAADISMLETQARLPWAGHSAQHALHELYDAVDRAKLTLIFVNTRSQAEFVFQSLWRINEKALPIALHHGSLDASQRRRVEQAMTVGALKAVVCTSTLDLGIDWGDVDLVVNIGAPKGSSRLMQRIGRANHRLDEPSRAILVPANRFEVLECSAAISAARAGTQDTPVERSGGLDVLAQHILGMACAEAFDADALYAEVISAAPYRDTSRRTFDRALEFVATGGYALKSYDRFREAQTHTKDGLWRVANGRIAQTYRMNVGTIVEADVLKVRLVRGRAKDAAPGALYTGSAPHAAVVCSASWRKGFLETLSPQDTFLFGGEILALQGIVENEAHVTRSHADTPRVPTYAGGKFPLSTYLAAGVRHLVSDSMNWKDLPDQVCEWLLLQQERSTLPGENDLLVETFPRGNRFFTVIYPFEGRLAHQTLGMLLTRRMERARLRPMGFVASDYALAIWSLGDVGAATKTGALVDGRSFRRGHARRRSRRVDAGIHADEAHVPQLRDHRRVSSSGASRARKRPAGR